MNKTSELEKMIRDASTWQMLRKGIIESNSTIPAKGLMLFVYYVGAGAAGVVKAIGRILCAFGFHGKPQYCGEIHVADIDRNHNRIAYANKLKCPKCGKVIALDWLP